MFERIRQAFHKGSEGSSEGRTLEPGELEFEGLRFSYSDTRKGSEETFDSLKLEFEEEITDTDWVYKGEDGLRVLCFYKAIPTFDSGDREWDSYRKLYIIPDGDKMNAYLVSGGYHIAGVKFYEDIRPLDAETENRLQNTTQKSSTDSGR